MGRTGRVVVALAIGWFLLAAPLASADVPAHPAASAGAVVVLQQAPPTTSPAPPGTGQPAPQQQWNQRTVVGVLGIALIAAVLLSRKLRKKPVFGNWKLK